VDKVSEMTDIRHCEACGQVKFPSDHWQRELAEQKEHYRVLENEMLVVNDERLCATLDAKQNMEIANEFKLTMEEYRKREADANKALMVAVGLLSTMPQFSNMHPNDVLEGILKETREMK
jgi:hypothetical protein